MPSPEAPHPPHRSLVCPVSQRCFVRTSRLPCCLVARDWGVHTEVHTFSLSPCPAPTLPGSGSPCPCHHHPQLLPRSLRRPGRSPNLARATPRPPLPQGWLSLQGRDADPRCLPVHAPVMLISWTLVSPLQARGHAFPSSSGGWQGMGTGNLEGGFPKWWAEQGDPREMAQPHLEGRAGGRKGREGQEWSQRGAGDPPPRPSRTSLWPCPGAPGAGGLRVREQDGGG